MPQYLYAIATHIIDVLNFVRKFIHQNRFRIVTLKSLKFIMQDLVFSNKNANMCQAVFNVGIQIKLLLF